MVKKQSIIVILLALLLAAVGTAFWWAQPEPLPDGLIQANGRLEGDRYSVASKYPGKVQHLRVHEGDWVDKGQLMAEMDAAQVEAKVRQAEAAVATAQAQLEAGRNDLATLRQQVPLKVASAQADVDHAKASLEAARSRVAQQQRDVKRLKTLLQKNTVDRERVEQAELALTVAKADVTTAKAVVEQAQNQLAEAQLGYEQIKSKESAVDALAAAVRQAQAVLAGAQSSLDDLSIVAPAAGIVVERIAEEGEVIAAGSPLFDIVNLDRLYLKVYVAERQIGRLRLGLPARIYTDAFPSQAFTATVRYIASRAEFTPKEVQTPDERVKLVYAVKLYLDENPKHRLTPGLPADAVIRWQEDAPWAKPRW